MHISSLFDLNTGDFFKIEGLIPAPVHVKCEALNLAGSIKIKPAMEMIEAFEQSGRIKPGDHLIESSSGNLGIALSMIASAKGYKFTCVTDPNAARESIATMKAFGTDVIVVETKDPQGGYLGTRVSLIKSLCLENHALVWVNQYSNSGNWHAHLRTTGPEILMRFPSIDHLFIGAGTGGTLMGCARYFREHSPKTRIIAVDAEGSVTFGSKPGVRRIPGLGTSLKPDIIDNRYISSVVFVSERDTVQMCRLLASHGLLAGGSTGTIMAGIEKSRSEISKEETVVTIMPDQGYKYLDTIYNDAWALQYGFIDCDETYASEEGSVSRSAGTRLALCQGS